MMTSSRDRCSQSWTGMKLWGARLILNGNTNIFAQGTIGLELLQQVPDLDIILVKKYYNRNNLLFLKLWTLRPFCFLVRFRSLEEAWRQELLWPPKISLQTAGYDALQNTNRMIMLRKKKVQTAFLQTFEQGRSSGASRKGTVALFAEQRKAVSGSDFSFFEY